MERVFRSWAVSKGLFEFINKNTYQDIDSGVRTVDVALVHVRDRVVSVQTCILGEVSCNNLK